ncbi:hypothetical protein FRC06_011714 [Ceratobasidium sp. 370]|nr:hypothetical protein FRC06_011714 [Ceratobasidium sp. 370]
MPRQPPSESAATFTRPSHTSESAKKHKMLAQSRDNATQPGPLSPSKRRKHMDNLLDHAYGELETREDWMEWLLSALELRDPRKNYCKFEFEVEELEEMMNEMSDADMDEVPPHAVGVYPETLKTYEQVKAPNNPKSQPAILPSHRATSSSTAPPPVSPPGLVLSSSGKPVPALSSARPTTKVSKARFNELHNLQAKMRPTTTSNHEATKVVGGQHPAPTSSEPAHSSRAHHPAPDGAQHPTPPTGARHPGVRHPAPAIGVRHPAPPTGIQHPTPPTCTRYPTPPHNPQQLAPPQGPRCPALPRSARSSAPSNNPSHDIRQALRPNNSEHGNVPPAAQNGKHGNVAQIGTANDGNEATEDAEDANDVEDADDNAASRRDRPKKRPKKMDAQLRDFGEATPVVALAMDMCRAKLAFAYPFPELIPAEDEPDGNDSANDGDDDDDNFTPITRSLFQDWAEACYDKAHSIVRRGKAPVEREERHVTYMSYQISQFRTQVKNAAADKVSSVYGLVRGDPQSAVRATDLTTQDKFLSPNLANDTHRFKHNIILDTIQLALFDGPQSLGPRYQHLLDNMMPRETIAFAACIIQRMIKSYIKNDKASRSLASDKDHAEFEHYVGMMDDMTKTNQATRLKNLQMRMLKTCLLATEGPAAMENMPIEWEENDSEPDKDLQEYLRACRKKRGEGKGKGKAREAAPVAGPSQLSGRQ